MTETPRVSVIIPTYNRAEIICETIENVFKQTYANLEVVVVDDGSKDDTRERLKPYGDRVKYIYQENAGPAAARNHGVSMCSGEIVAFQDSDDTWHSSKIERQVSVLERAGKEIVCCLCNSDVKGAQGHILYSFDRVKLKSSLTEGIWLNPLEVLSTRFVLFNQAVAIRRDVFLSTGGFDESFRIMEDVEFQLRLALCGPWSFISAPLATREERFSTSLSKEGNAGVLLGYELQIREKMFKYVDGDPCFAFAKRIVKNELKRARRQHRAFDLKQKGSAGAVVGRALGEVERVRSACYRRSPWFPQMKVAPLPAASMEERAEDDKVEARHA